MFLYIFVNRALARKSVLVQFGLANIAGYTAASKLYGALELAALAYGFAMVTYTGQNIGAGKLDRARQGVRAAIEVLEDDEFMPRRKSGGLACYSATWTADFNDPDNFIYTFFGSRDNARFRSLCYQDEEVMARVRAARRIVDADARLEEYRALERKIVQEDAAWIPLFSRLRYYVTSERASGIQSSARSK